MRWSFAAACPLQAGAKGGGVAGNPLERPLVRGRIDQQEIRVFDGVDEVLRRCSRHEAGIVREPPVLGGELYDVLFAFAVDHVAAQEPGGDERGVRRHVAGALQELTGRKRPGKEECFEKGELFPGELSSTLEVRAQGVECRHGSRRFGREYATESVATSWHAAWRAEYHGSTSMPEPLRLAFLGCGFITRVHSRHLRSLAGDVVCSYASRDRGKAEAFCREYRGAASYAGYTAAIEDPRVDAVVVAVPPRFHLDLTLQALEAGKHVLVEKPAYLRMADYRSSLEARNRAGRVVLVGENDHYKPLAQCLRRLLAEDVIGEMVFAHFTTHREKAQDRGRLAQRRRRGRR